MISLKNLCKYTDREKVCLLNDSIREITEKYNRLKETKLKTLLVFLYFLKDKDIRWIKNLKTKSILEDLALVDIYVELLENFLRKKSSVLVEISLENLKSAFLNQNALLFSQLDKKTQKLMDLSQKKTKIVFPTKIENILHFRKALSKLGKLSVSNKDKAITKAAQLAAVSTKKFATRFIICETWLKTNNSEANNALDSFESFCFYLFFDFAFDRSSRPQAKLQRWLALHTKSGLTLNENNADSLLRDLILLHTFSSNQGLLASIQVSGSLVCASFYFEPVWFQPCFHFSELSFATDIADWLALSKLLLKKHLLLLLEAKRVLIVAGKEGSIRVVWEAATVFKKLLNSNLDVALRIRKIFLQVLSGKRNVELSSLLLLAETVDKKGIQVLEINSNSFIYFRELSNFFAANKRFPFDKDNLVAGSTTISQLLSLTCQIEVFLTCLILQTDRETIKCLHKKLTNKLTNFESNLKRFIVKILEKKAQIAFTSDSIKDTVEDKLTHFYNFVLMKFVPNRAKFFI